MRNRPLSPRRGSVRRLAIGLAALAALATTAIAWASLSLVGATFDRQLSSRLETLDAGAGRVLETEGAEVLQALAAVEEQLRNHHAELLERWLLGRPEPNAAARLERTGGLDLLEVAGADGTILSADPSRVGLVDSQLSLFPTDRAVLRRSARPVGSEADVAVMARRMVPVGGRSVMLVGGRRLGKPFLERVAGSDTALLISAPDAEPLVSGKGAGLDRGVVGEWIARGSEADETVPVGGGRWMARLHSLFTETGERVGTVVVAVDRTPTNRLLASLRRGFLVLGGVAVMLAALAGAWIAGRMTRPLDELIRAVDSIAAGEADYTFPGAARDELGGLTEAFSRLQRSLEIQRQRSLAAERVAAWREVARRVAHEVKNPLAPIRLTVQNLLRARGRGHERFDEMFEDGMRTIQEEVEQLSRLVGEFSEFARLPAPSPRAVDLEQLLDGALDLHAAEPGMRIERHYAGNLPSIAADPDQLSRALKNVVVNAVEAMGGNGVLEVRTELEPKTVVVEVADDGPGLSAEAARRLFEPYFTTKQTGTGLGMAITYRILAEHGGDVVAETRPQGGTRVMMRLPLSPPESRARGKREASR
jgi:signal transduction histidine kinase